jgi:flagellar hook-length control protein FliK
LILPFLQSGTRHSQDIGVRSSINHVHPGHQSNSTSSFLHLLNQSQNHGIHDPFPRTFIEQQIQHDNQISNEQRRSEPSKEPDSTDELERSRLAQESQEEKPLNESTNDQEPNHKVSVDTLDQTKKDGVEILDPLVVGAELGKPKDQIDGSLSKHVGNSDQDLEIQVDTNPSSQIMEKARLSKTSEQDESQESRSSKEPAVSNDLVKGSLEIQELNTSVLGSKENISIKTDLNPGSNPELTQQTKFSEQLNTGDYKQPPIGSSDQVIQVVDLRTKQRSTGKNIHPAQQIEPSETLSKTQVLRELRALQGREEYVSAPVLRNVQSTFGVISDLNQPSFMRDSSGIGPLNDVTRTQLTLGSESFIRFFDQKSSRPWTQAIQRLFGRDLPSSGNMLGLATRTTRSFPDESAQTQQQLMAHQQIQEQTRSVMSPSSTDQAQVSSYLKTAGNAEILKSAKFILKDHDKGEIKLILKPERLGEIKIHLSLTNNSIEAQILVDNKEVEEAFRENLQELIAAFQEQGFEIGDFSVSTRESKLASLLLDDQSVIQIPGLDSKWLDQEVYGLEEIHIDLAI